MSDANPTGLFSSLKRLGELTLATAQNRIELFVVELQEEKARFVQAVLLAAAAIALGAVALTLVTITVVVLCWDNGRVPALGVLSGLYIMASAAAAWRLKKKLGAPPFSATQAELEKDRACFQADN